MKLIFCMECQDTYNISQKHVKSCTCGNTRGVYINELDARMTSKSDSYFMMGFSNPSLQNSVASYFKDGPREDGMGINFDAFVITEPCPTFKKIDDEEFDAIVEKLFPE